jgi:uncharacterized protein (DUF2461 family)
MATITRKVIDSNRLRSPELREYLSRSKHNFAVLTDYAAMEAHKGDTLVTIFESMAVVAEFPEQVIVLKTTGVVCGLNGRGEGLQKRLIDQSQTREFGIYCKRLAEAKSGNVRFQRQLLAHEREAENQMGHMFTDAHNLPEAFEKIASEHTKEELAIIRKGESYPVELLRKMMKNIWHTAFALFENHPNIRGKPKLEELPNLFIFRTALCAYLLALEWIAVGGAKNVKIERLRNDVVDINFAAYGTYFDGLMTNDYKVQKIHYIARYFLTNACECRISETV